LDYNLIFSYCRRDSKTKRW